jgi:hypothetical protein
MNNMQYLSMNNIQSHAKGASTQLINEQYSISCVPMTHVLSVGIGKHAPDAGQYTFRELHSSVAGTGWTAVDGQSHLTVGLLAAYVVRALLFGLPSVIKTAHHQLICGHDANDFTAVLASHFLFTIATPASYM